MISDLLSSGSAQKASLFLPFLAAFLMICDFLDNSPSSLIGVVTIADQRLLQEVLQTGRGVICTPDSPVQISGVYMWKRKGSDKLCLA